VGEGLAVGLNDANAVVEASQECGLLCVGALFPGVAGVVFVTHGAAEVV